MLILFLHAHFYNFRVLLRFFAQPEKLETTMYIIAIAWLYVVFMMSITEQSVIAGIMTFFLYGVFPLTIVLYLMGTPQRKRNRQMKEKFKAIQDAEKARVADAFAEKKASPEWQKKRALVSLRYSSAL